MGKTKRRSGSGAPHASNPWFEKLVNYPVMEALRDRTIKIDMGQLLKLFSPTNK